MENEKAKKPVVKKTASKAAKKPVMVAKKPVTTPKKKSVTAATKAGAGAAVKNGAKKVTVQVPSAQRKKKLEKRWGILIGLAVLAVVLLGSGVGIWISSIHNTEPVVVEEDITTPEDEEPEPEGEDLPTENTDDLVAEPTINDSAAYQVAAYKPRYMTIASVGVYNVPIVEVGMWAGNQMGSPTNPRIIGWYYRSALPGQEGASVMDGHGGDLGIGIFKTLPQVPIGGEIVIEMGDGRKVTYVVADKVYRKAGPEADRYMDVAYQTLPSGAPTLTLITCTGNWIQAEQTYDTRLFVRAALK